MARTETGRTLTKDADGNPIPVCLDFVLEDATGTPLVSPLTTITTVQTFNVPDNAVVFRLRSSAAGRIGDNATLDGTSGEGYFVVPADTDVFWPCAAMTAVYFKPDSSATISFAFEKV